VELFRKNNSRFYWYDFKVRGKRYRGSTKEANNKDSWKARTRKSCGSSDGAASRIFLNFAFRRQSLPGLPHQCNELWCLAFFENPRES
jgi:hypothetical protein